MHKIRFRCRWLVSILDLNATLKMGSAPDQNSVHNITNHTDDLSKMVWFSTGNATVILTATSKMQHEWTSLTIFESFITILLLILNGGVAAIYLLVKELHTSFAVYIVTLLISNIAFGVGKNSLDVASGLYGQWWMGPHLCGWYQYIVWVVGAVPINAHLMIAVNRVWAISWPTPYRNYHSNYTALLSVLAMLLYVHVAVVPGVVLDAMYYRLPEIENGCNINVAPIRLWAILVDLVVYDVPILFIAVSGPLIVYKWKQQRKVTANGVRLRTLGPSATHQGMGRDLITF